MVEFKRGLIDKQQQGQLLLVFQKFAEDQDDMTWDQFKDYLFASGMQFLVQHYTDDMKAKLFKGNFENNRVTFPAFMNYLEENCKYENTPDQYERLMDVFQEDVKGHAQIQDVIRVMKDHGQMSKEEIEYFLKIVTGMTNE